MEFFTRVLSANTRSRENNVNKLVESQSIIQVFKENLEGLKNFVQDKENHEVQSLMDMLYDSSFPEEQMFMKAPVRTRLQARKELVLRILGGLDTLGIPVTQQMVAFVRKHGMDMIAETILKLMEILAPLVDNKSAPEFTTDDVLDAMDFEWHSTKSTNNSKNNSMGSPSLIKSIANSVSNSNSPSRASVASVTDIVDRNKPSSITIQPFSRTISDKSIFSRSLEATTIKSLRDVKQSNFNAKSSHVSGSTPQSIADTSNASSTSNSGDHQIRLSSYRRLDANVSPKLSNLPNLEQLPEERLHHVRDKNASSMGLSHESDLLMSSHDSENQALNLSGDTENTMDYSSTSSLNAPDLSTSSSNASDLSTESSSNAPDLSTSSSNASDLSTESSSNAPDLSTSSSNASDLSTESSSNALDDVNISSNAPSRETVDHAGESRYPYALEDPVMESRSHQEEMVMVDSSHDGGSSSFLQEDHMSIPVSINADKYMPILSFEESITGHNVGVGTLEDHNSHEDHIQESEIVQAECETNADQSSCILLTKSMEETSITHNDNDGDGDDIMDLHHLRTAKHPMMEVSNDMSSCDHISTLPVSHQILSRTDPAIDNICVEDDTLPTLSDANDCQGEVTPPYVSQFVENIMEEPIYEVYDDTIQIRHRPTIDMDGHGDNFCYAPVVEGIHFIQTLPEDVSDVFNGKASLPMSLEPNMDIVPNTSICACDNVPISNAIDPNSAKDLNMDTISVDDESSVQIDEDRNMEETSVDDNVPISNDIDPNSAKDRNMDTISVDDESSVEINEARTMDEISVGDNDASDLQINKDYPTLDQSTIPDNQCENLKNDVEDIQCAHLIEIHCANAHNPCDDEKVADIPKESEGAEKTFPVPVIISDQETMNSLVDEVDANTSMINLLDKDIDNKFVVECANIDMIDHDDVPVHDQGQLYVQIADSDRPHMNLDKQEPANSHNQDDLYKGSHPLDHGHSDGIDSIKCNAIAPCSLTNNAMDMENEQKMNQQDLALVNRQLHMRSQSDQTLMWHLSEVMKAYKANNLSASYHGGEIACPDQYDVNSYPVNLRLRFSECHRGIESMDLVYMNNRDPSIKYHGGNMSKLWMKDHNEKDNISTSTEESGPSSSSDVSPIESISSSPSAQHSSSGEVELSNGNPYGYNDMNQQGIISTEEQRQRSDLKDGGGPSFIQDSVQEIPQREIRDRDVSETDEAIASNHKPEIQTCSISEDLIRHPTNLLHVESSGKESMHLPSRKQNCDSRIFGYRNPSLIPMPHDDDDDDDDGTDARQIMPECCKNDPAEISTSSKKKNHDELMSMNEYAGEKDQYCSGMASSSSSISFLSEMSYNSSPERSVSTDRDLGSCDGQCTMSSVVQIMASQMRSSSDSGTSYHNCESVGTTHNKESHIHVLSHERLETYKKSANDRSYEELNSGGLDEDAKPTMAHNHGHVHGHGDDDDDGGDDDEHELTHLILKDDAKPNELPKISEELMHHELDQSLSSCVSTDNHASQQLLLEKHHDSIVKSPTISSPRKLWNSTSTSSNKAPPMSHKNMGCFSCFRKPRVE